MAGLGRSLHASLLLGQGCFQFSIFYSQIVDLHRINKEEKKIAE